MGLRLSMTELGGVGGSVGHAAGNVEEQAVPVVSDDAQDLEGVGLLLLRGRVMALLPAVRAVLVLAALVLVAAPELLLDCLLALLDLLGGAALARQSAPAGGRGLALVA